MVRSEEGRGVDLLCEDYSSGGPDGCVGWLPIDQAMPGYLPPLCEPWTVAA